jgi:predicted XRE-type DNA-binding protein
MAQNNLVQNKSAEVLEHIQSANSVLLLKDMHETSDTELKPDYF